MFLKVFFFSFLRFHTRYGPYHMDYHHMGVQCTSLDSYVIRLVDHGWSRIQVSELEDDFLGWTLVAVVELS